MAREDEFTKLIFKCYLAFVNTQINFLFSIYKNRNNFSIAQEKNEFCFYLPEDVCLIDIS